MASKMKAKRKPGGGKSRRAKLEVEEEDAGVLASGELSPPINASEDVYPYERIGEAGTLTVGDSGTESSSTNDDDMFSLVPGFMKGSARNAGTFAVIKVERDKGNIHFRLRADIDPGWMVQQQRARQAAIEAAAEAERKLAQVAEYKRKSHTNQLDRKRPGRIAATAAKSSASEQQVRPSEDPLKHLKSQAKLIKVEPKSTGALANVRKAAHKISGMKDKKLVKKQKLKSGSSAKMSSKTQPPQKKKRLDVSVVKIKRKVVQVPRPKKSPIKKAIKKTTTAFVKSPRPPKPVKEKKSESRKKETSLPKGKIQLGTKHKEKKPDEVLRKLKKQENLKKPPAIDKKAPPKIKIVKKVTPIKVKSEVPKSPEVNQEKYEEETEANGSRKVEGTEAEEQFETLSPDVQESQSDYDGSCESSKSGPSSRVSGSPKSSHLSSVSSHDEKNHEFVDEIPIVDETEEKQLLEESIVENDIIHSQDSLGSFKSSNSSKISMENQNFSDTKSAKSSQEGSLGHDGESAQIEDVEAKSPGIAEDQRTTPEMSEAKLDQHLMWDVAGGSRLETDVVADEELADIQNFQEDLLNTLTDDEYELIREKVEEKKRKKQVKMSEHTEESYFNVEDSDSDDHLSEALYEIYMRRKKSSESASQDEDTKEEPQSPHDRPRKSTLKKQPVEKVSSDSDEIPVEDETNKFKMCDTCGWNVCQFDKYKPDPPQDGEEAPPPIEHSECPKCNRDVIKERPTQDDCINCRGVFGSATMFELEFDIKAKKSKVICKICRGPLLIAQKQPRTKRVPPQGLRMDIKREPMLSEVFAKWGERYDQHTGDGKALELGRLYKTIYQKSYENAPDLNVVRVRPPGGDIPPRPKFNYSSTFKLDYKYWGKSRKPEHPRVVCKELNHIS